LVSFIGIDKSSNGLIMSVGLIKDASNTSAKPFVRLGEVAALRVVAVELVPH